VLFLAVLIEQFLVDQTVQNLISEDRHLEVRHLPPLAYHAIGKQFYLAIERLSGNDGSIDGRRFIRRRLFSRGFLRTCRTDGKEQDHHKQGRRGTKSVFALHDNFLSIKRPVSGASKLFSVGSTEQGADPDFNPKIVVKG
jgi:hypothetical protein